MAVFYFTLISSYLLSLMARIADKKRNLGVVFAIIVASILIIVSGLRTNIGDTNSYINLYKLIGPEYNVFNGAFEPGFLIFLTILKTISSDPQFMLIITSLIINVCNIWILKKYTKHGYFELAVFMYIASGYYIVTMNGIRQSLVAAMLFTGTHLIIKGKFKWYLLLVICMSTFHTSSLVMIPLYFIARQEAWSKNIIRLVIIFSFGMLLYDPLMKIVFRMLEGTRYAGYESLQASGANILRIAVSAVPVLLAYINRDELKKMWPESNVFVNLSLLNFVIMCFAKFTWIFARFTIFTQLYTFILIPVVIKKCFKNEKERRLIYLGLILCYTIFFVYENEVALRMKYLTDFNAFDFFYKIIN